jgi:tRNA A-37 threonylcarbamoyl transferase component Bud32
MDPEPHADRDESLDNIVLSYLQAAEGGSPPDRAELLKRHPDLAGPLEAFFADLDLLGRLVAPLAACAAGAQVAPAAQGAVADQMGGRQTISLPADARATVAMPAGGEAPAAPPDFAGRTIGDFELLSLLGKGGMGVVYKAREKSLGRIVALKMILAGAQARPADRERLRAEALAVARLEHPNIVRIYAVGEHDGLPYLALEYVEGGSLADEVETTRKPTDAARLVRALAEAMQVVHAAGIIHRDLKPGNVLLAKDGTPKLTDFGLAKRLDADVGATLSGTILGTPSYMPPEQAQGRIAEVGPRSDVYALGAILYELLVGRPPFKGVSLVDTLMQVSQAEPVAPRQLQPAVPRDLETICLTCLHKEPARRYDSAGALTADLGRFLEGQPILARPTGAGERLLKWARRRPATAALLFVSALALAVVFGMVVWFNRELRAELERTEAAATLRLAERIDSDLRQLARTPEMMAATLEQRPDWTEAQLDAWMRAALGKDSKLFGTTVAFEPRQFDPQREDFALYAYRKEGGLATKQLKPPDYKLYRTWPWYTRPKQQGGPVWSEPFEDEGGGNIPMITYSVPLRRDGKFVGVVTADLSIGYFQVLHGWLADLKMGEGSYGFVVSREGRFISHPSAAYRLPLKITEADDFQADDELRSLSARLLREERGTATGVDPYLGRSARFHFARIPSAGWTFVAVVGD